jgi:hypothetical protein
VDHDWMLKIQFLPGKFTQRFFAIFFRSMFVSFGTSHGSIFYIIGFDTLLMLFKNGPNKPAHKPSQSTNSETLKKNKKNKIK